MTDPGPARAHDERSDLALPARLFVAMSALLLVAQHVSARVLDPDHPYRFGVWQGLQQYIDGWQQFDGHEYVRIATEGYSYVVGERSNIVWFPLYPLLLRGLNTVVGEPTLVGIIISALAGLGATLLYWRWLRDKGFEGTGRLAALGVLMLYPYGWYLYGVVHSDSLFLALVIGAFLCIEHDRLLLAGLVGALATATRPTGMALMPALIVAGLEHEGVLTVPDGAKGLVDRFRIPVRVALDRLSPRAVAPALSALGIGAYMVYLGVRFGDPIAFITNQRVYHAGDMPVLKRAFFVAWRDSDDWLLPLTLTGQAIVALVVLVTVPAVGRRFGWGYAVFCAVLVAIPTISTEDFMGTGRYLMAAFPAAALIGERLADRVVARRVFLGACFVLIVVFDMGFSRSWYIT